MVDFANMTEDQFNALVQAKVEEQLSSREEAEARQEAEAALAEARETFEALKASIEAKDAKIREYEEALSNLDVDPTAAEVAANEKIVELETELAEAKRRAEVAEAALDTLAKEETAATRMDELEEAGVALEDEAAEAQYAKVRDMSDDEFESYRNELVALKSKYASTSEEAGEDEVETAELSADEIKMIAQSLGCDPQDSQCISLVQEVAQKMSEVSRNRRQRKDADGAEASEEEKGNEDNENAADGQDNKETASAKSQPLSIGEAITRSLDQNFQANASLKDELSQLWEDHYAEKRGEKKSE